MEKVEVYLTPVQHKKFLNKQPFQLSAYQLKASDKAVGKKFHVELTLTKSHYKKLLSNVRANKGYRFTQEAITGGSLLGELWNGVKNVASKVAEYVPADVIRKGVKTGLTAAATAAGTMVGNPELGLLASPFIDKAVDYGERGYNMYTKNPNVREQLQQNLPQMQQYVEERVPVARKAREAYKKYAPKARKVYQKARRVYYNDPDDEDDEDDDEDDYEPAPRRRRQAPQPRYSAPAPSDYMGYQGRGLTKGSPEMKAKMAKLRAMRKGGKVAVRLDGKVDNNIIYDFIGNEQRTTSRDAKAPIATSPLNGGKLVKGSPEMKAKMAMLRAKRGIKQDSELSGKGIKPRGRKVKGGWNPFSADDWNSVGDAISGAANSAVETIADTATNVGNTIADTATDVGYKIKDGATDAFNEIGDSLRGAADNVVGFYQSAANTVSPIVNAAITEVAKNLPSEADAKAFGKSIASALIKQGIPQATSFICGALAEALFPEAGPVAGMMGSQLGTQLGNLIADKVSEETGYGLRHSGHRVLIKGGTLHRGVPYPHYTEATKARIQTHGLAHKTPNGLHRGGSFRELGGSLNDSLYR